MEVKEDVTLQCHDGSVVVPHWIRWTGKIWRGSNCTSSLKSIALPQNNTASNLTSCTNTSSGNISLYNSTLLNCTNKTNVTAGNIHNELSISANESFNSSLNNATISNRIANSPAKNTSCDKPSGAVEILPIQTLNRHILEHCMNRRTCNVNATTSQFTEPYPNEPLANRTLAIKYSCHPGKFENLV